VTWEWVAFLAVAAFWGLGMQAIHSWKEVRMIQRMTDEMLRDQVGQK